ncbi:MAG: hypothetical protein KDB65_05765 [Calditrichaeota bacterium]|nr:hypothetical protein [Calditrichota bacterium]MCB9367726.1 hypothetical protein [Calditrichota bacterium]
MSCKSLLFTLAVFTAALPAAAQEDSLLHEWRVLSAQSELIKSNTPYLVFDAGQSSLSMKLGNANVWVMKEDSGTKPLDIERMTRDFKPDSELVFSVESVRLLEYEPRFPDSLLKIVSDALDMAPSLLQREIPVSFEVKWRNGPTLQVYSLPENDPVKPTVSFRQRLGLIFSGFGGADYEVQTDREMALTLYRVMQRGALTLVLR